MNNITFYNTKQKYKFWYDFLIIFLLGNIIIGFFESFTLNMIYETYAQTEDIKNKGFYIRLFVFLPAIVKTICLGYTIYSFIILYRASQYLMDKLLIRVLLIAYYILCIFTISWLHFSSPITYFTSYIYNGIAHNDFTHDVIHFHNNLYLAKRA